MERRSSLDKIWNCILHSPAREALDLDANDFAPITLGVHQNDAARLDLAGRRPSMYWPARHLHGLFVLAVYRANRPVRPNSQRSLPAALLRLRARNQRT